MIKQIKISPSGIQIWKPQVLASSNTHFAFASTLAIYLYENKTFQLEKVFTHADQNISAIEIDPSSQQKYLAQATIDKKLIIWDIESENVKFNASFNSPIQRIEWNKSAHNSIMLLLQNGEIKLADLNNKAVTTIEVIKDEVPTCIKWNSKRDNVAAVGFKSGKISFVDVQTLQTLQMEFDETEINGDPESGVSDLAWDPNEDHLLVSFNDGSQAMIDFNGFIPASTILRFTYEKQSVGVNNICWRDDKSGDFITSTRKVGTLRLWNVASREPKQIIKVGSSGIHCMTKLKGDSKRMLIGFINGAVQVFNLEKRRIEFQSEAGHAETVFDLEFSPTDRNIFASCSYDGTVRIWDSNNVKLLQINDTLRNSPIQKEEKHIIYSISWHPTEQKIALAGSLGFVMIYDALKSKLLGYINPTSQKVPSFKVDWNPNDPNLLLVGSQSQNSFVVNCKDYKNLTIQQQIFYDSPVFGVCWSPNNKDEYAIGCGDGMVLICNTKQSQPLIKLPGHEKKVFNVVYNKQIPYILASGSDDLTIRIWNSQDGSTVKVLKGHTHNVRAIQFNPELPWLLVSGAWDATIKLWDVRSGNCIHTIVEHSADVYGITFHPQRPFVFVSSSRDTTLRFFAMDQLVTTIRNQMLMDAANTKFYDTPDKAFSTKGEYKLSSEESQRLIQQAQKGGFKNQIELLRSMYCFLNLNDGQEDIFNILDLLGDANFQTKRDSYELKVLHCAQLAQAMKEKADKLRKATGMSMYNTQYSKKEDRLQEAAKIYLRTGQFREYCETLFDLEEYDKALNFAPAVSIEYWQELAERKTEILSKQGHEDAAISAIISNQCDRAIEIFANNEDYEDGKLVKALQLTGVFSSVLDGVRSKDKSDKNSSQELLNIMTKLKTQPLYKIDPQLAAFVREQSQIFYYQGKPLLAAACYLSISDFKNAIEILVRNNEIYIAYYIAQNQYPEALSEVALLISEKAEKYFQTDICLQVLSKDVKDKRQVELFKRRLINSALMKDPSFGVQNEALAQKCQSQGDDISALENYLIANKIDLAAEISLKLMRKGFASTDINQINQMFEAAELIQTANITKISQEQVNYYNINLFRVKDQIIFYSAFTGFIKSIYFGFYDVMMTLVQQILDMSSKVQEKSANSFIQAIEQAITGRQQLKQQFSVKEQHKDSLTSIDVNFGADQTKKARYQALIEGFRQYQKNSKICLNFQIMLEGVLFDEPGIYLYQASGQNLQGNKHSAFSQSIIKVNFINNNIFRATNLHLRMERHQFHRRKHQNGLCAIDSHL
ncbi:wd repeat-containing protein 17 [Stylonychia lemnae]|uniref:Wd repeat-containing protein 17 n=1 Tax=Stylonychia lemnae TaxID=5949 RepID=A0A078AZC2_STYLE|nr:wd repeat-containing protein 17 [Stylonychia lemnae]|eukprot:CDW86163.1 wd repeat-containing protein 17 [Stylonychia lemnae]